ncbi:hypothetical protein J3B02_004172 [Coemansia erecta]|nr:hypothetical protein J3B02_004172 [Coemansia erecta]
MSDYSAWSQLFRLNPDSPQTPMLSNQELQEELALWSNAQFQLEPVAEEPHSKKQTISNSTSISSSLSTSSDDYQQQQHPQAIPWELMMGTSTSDLLSAIAAVSPTAQQPWASLAPQQQPSVPGTPMVINGVPMLPLVPMAQQQQQQGTKSRPESIVSSSSKAPAAASKALVLMPAPSSALQIRHTVIMPRGGMPVQPTQSLSEATPQKTASQRRSSSATAKRSFSSAVAAAAATTAAEDSDGEADDSTKQEHDNDIAAADGNDNEQSRRLRAAEEDKRRRNTAASARFRVKKKLKEQALERTAREMTAKAEALEKRVHELETETRWLKSLITEKDPSVLTSVHCPCHHPNGLDMSATPSSSSQLQMQQHLSIAPTPAHSDDHQQQQQVFKRPRI